MGGGFHGGESECDRGGEKCQVEGLTPRKR